MSQYAAPLSVYQALQHSRASVWQRSQARTVVEFASGGGAYPPCAEVEMSSASQRVGQTEQTSELICIQAAAEVRLA